MRIINGRKYMTTGDIGAFINRSQNSVVRWCKYSDLLEEMGDKRIIPKPLLINGQRLFTLEQARIIKEFAESENKYGLMAEFNRKSLGQRGKDIEKRIKAREKKRAEVSEQEQYFELDNALSKVNRKAVDYKDRFKKLKRDS